MLLDQIDEAFENLSQVNSIAHEKLNQLFLDYLYLGGMPKILQTYIENNYQVNDRIKRNREALLEDYIEDNHNEMYLGTKLREEIIRNMDSIFRKLKHHSNSIIATLPF